jgi:hypothetical protein
MTAAVRPQQITDAVAGRIAEHRAKAAELVGGYRAGLAGTKDELAAFAGVAAAAWTELCSREMSQVLAAAVQVIAEMQDAAAAPEPRRWLDKDGAHGQERPDGLIALETENGLSGLFVCTDAANLADGYGPVTEVQPAVQADRAGVDRHWGPLASTGGESL